MKVFIGSDIHGSETNLLKFLRAMDSVAESGESVKAVLLGDIYNHGPRNPFPEGYAPMKVAALLNARKDSVTAIKGNCDSEVDQTISEFKIDMDRTSKWGGHTLFFTHGHVFNPELPPLEAEKGDVVFYGHFHEPNLTVKDGIRFICVGALGLSANGAPCSYAVLEEGKVTVKNLDGSETLFEVEL